MGIFYVLPVILFGCATSEPDSIEEAIADDEKADAACPTIEVPTASNACPSGRFTPKRASGCITAYTCSPGAPVTELFTCTTNTKFAGAVTTFKLNLLDPETTLVDMKFANEDEPTIETMPADSVVGMLADQSDGYIGHRGRGLRIYSNSIDIQYTTAFFYASTDYKTGWVRVEDRGGYGHGNHWGRFTCTRKVQP